MKRIIGFVVALWLFVTPWVNAQPYQVGVCLSGGGALGFAHIGVLEALRESGIYPQVISGTSMGAVVGVFYAAGYSPQNILEIVQHEKMYRTSNIIRFHIGKNATGFSDHVPLLNVLKKYIPYDNYDSLSMPFYSCATNLTTGNIEYTSHGDNLRERVAASSSIPGIFEAVKIDSCYYVDGGVLNNLPAQPIRPLCKVLISVVVSPFTPNSKIKNISDVLHDVLKVMSKNNSAPGIKMSDYVIYVNIDPRLDMFSFKNYKNIYFAGYNIGKRFIADHPDLLKYATQKPKVTTPVLKDTIGDEQ
ncbi:patatin-like phospholipase family protein [Microbacter margulisiae]|uniref:NTE family protein n=1 Tax=Microbacter margulisiae TaxID=1350067 RepID=A0A7W5DPT4_9PORP|nr:patatin-like phospholipase family protein [Microbacter margulisiae]MBB3186073.1 NTE family protein [Microbacter margulisiae]